MNEPQMDNPALVTRSEIGLIDLALVVAQNIRLLVFGSLAIGLLTLAYSFTITPVFTAKTTFLPPQQQQSAASIALQSLGAVAGLAGATAGLKSPTDQFIALLGSRTIVDRMIDRFDLMKIYESQYREHCRMALRGNTLVTTGKDGLIALEVQDESPQRAAEMAAAYVNELETLLRGLALTEAQQRRQFFEKQLDDTKHSLTRAQQALQASGISASALKMQPQAAVVEVAELKARITAQEVKLQSIRGYYSDNSPDTSQAQIELAALRRQLAKTEAAVAPSTEDTDYVSKYREFKYQETLFDLFARQFELAKLDESREGSSIQIVDKAVPPELKSKPKKGLMAVIATLVGGFLLLLFVFIRFAVRVSTADPALAAKLVQVKAALHPWRRSAP
jgi:uncharacterized protein involved in exopolysaccharide biosynthesis